MKGTQEEYIEVLNLMGYGDVSHLPFVQFFDLCRRYSLSRAKYGKGVRVTLTRDTKYVVGGVSRMELGNLLENFKTNILGTISS